MDRSNFGPIDLVAQEKWAALSSRLNDIEPPDPPPSNFQLYGNLKEVHDDKTRWVRRTPKKNAAVASIPSSASLPKTTEAEAELPWEPSSKILLSASRIKLPDEEAHEWLSEHGFELENIGRPSEGGVTVFHLAVEHSNIPLLQWLLDHCSSTLLKRGDESGITPLQIASMKEDLAVTRWLYNNGAADVYKFDPYFGDSTR